jgi:hypothetical protein
VTEHRRPDLALCESPRAIFSRRATNFEPEPAGTHVMFKPVGICSGQRPALADVGGGIAVALWPAQLMPQAEWLTATVAARRRRAQKGDAPLPQALGFRRRRWPGPEPLAAASRTALVTRGSTHAAHLAPTALPPRPARPRTQLRAADNARMSGHAGADALLGSLRL